MNRFRDERIIRKSGLFDAEYYLRENPDVAASHVDPLRHFVLMGASEGRNPSEAFDVSNYMKQNADLAATGINPLAHYIKLSKSKRRLPKAIETEEQRLERLIREAGLFDDAFYLKNNPNIAETNLTAKDADQFMADILPYMKDSRYIKIGNKPILLIYKTQLYAKSEYDGFVRRIREIAVKNGFDGIYLISPIEDFMDHEHLEDTQDKYTLDALMEFHPIAGRKGWNLKQEEFFDPACRSECYDVEDFVANRKYILDTRAKVFPGLFANWDNSPRRYDRGASILQNTPENYKKWLADLIRWTREHNAPEERFIFVNAWNEWAEGAHLEPDTYYGYAYLQKTREALEESVEN